MELFVWFWLMSPSWVMVLELPIIVYFLKFLAQVSKKSMAVIEIYVYVADINKLF